MAMAGKRLSIAADNVAPQVMAELTDRVSVMTAILECSLFQRRAGRSKRKQRADRYEKTGSDGAESRQGRGQTDGDAAERRWHKLSRGEHRTRKMTILCHEDSNC